MVAEFLQWTVDVVDYFDYPGVLVMMMLESTFVPLPSELIMPQAGYLVAQGKMNFGIALGMATIGSVLGGLINYSIAYFLGRPFFMKYGKYVLCPPHKFEKMERFFLTHGEISTFTGRLLLGVRHFISFPAGLAKMNKWHFIFYTALGAGIWSAILETIGYFVGANKELIKKYYHEATLGTLLLCIVVVSVYVWWYRRKRARAVASAVAATD